jgi:hypothetical protein
VSMHPIKPGRLACGVESTFNRRICPAACPV